MAPTPRTHAHDKSYALGRRLVRGHNSGYDNDFRGIGHGCWAPSSRAVQIDADCAEAHFNVGKTLNDQGKLEEAMACFRRAVELMPALAEPVSCSWRGSFRGYRWTP
jgi:tetratricopeptide (TPR) repeat protein